MGVLALMFVPLFWDQSLEGRSFEEGWGSVKAEPVYSIRSLDFAPQPSSSSFPHSAWAVHPWRQTVGIRTLWLSEDLTTPIIPDSSHPTLPSDLASVSSSMSLKIFLLSWFQKPHSDVLMWVFIASFCLVHCVLSIETHASSIWEMLSLWCILPFSMLLEHV